MTPSMIYIGIDPGLTGAVAALLEDSGCMVFDTPIAETVRGGKKRQDYAPALMASTLREIGVDALVIIERQQAFPGQGSSSTFATGRGYGLWEGIVAALGLPYQTVHPATWKKAMLGAAAGGKDAARLEALRLFPALADQLSLKKHHGRAEALLIAEYGRRTLG